MSYNLTLIYFKSDLDDSSKTRFNIILSPPPQKKDPSFAWQMVNIQWLLLQVSNKDQSQKFKKKIIHVGLNKMVGTEDSNRIRKC